ncbi:MAG: DUF1254 domain-containing protein [Ideonella sp.]|jgi:hypothetical protein|nr:DUF1254 domain-containing protein [Ideonella sp.]
MKLHQLPVLCSVLAMGLFSVATQAQALLPDELAEAEAFALGYQAYVTGAVYARSQILMEKDIHPKAPLNAPLNAFNVYPGLATPQSTIDFTPNNDTVYGLAWLDLRQGPVLMTIPKTSNRYWTVQATDWALNTFGYVGSRVKSTAGTYAYVPPGWKGDLPKGVTRIDATTTGVFLQARTVVKPEVASDIDPVIAEIKTYRLEPLNKVAKYPQADPASPVPNTKLNNPVWQSLEFFGLLNRAWAFGGVRAQDGEVAMLASRLGIGPGLTFDPAKLTEAQRRGLTKAAQVGFKRVVFHRNENGELRNGWRFATNLGHYEDNRLLASTVGMVGYGANRAEEAMYLPAFSDAQNEPLSGGRRYRIRFAAGQLPPVNAFWSVTLYNLGDNQLRENPINRYAFGDRSPTLKRNADGSIDIHVQRDKPEGDAANNWLPTGNDGAFWLIMRMYEPQAKALSGAYVLPGIERLP